MIVDQDDVERALVGLAEERRNRPGYSGGLVAGRDDGHHGGRGRDTVDRRGFPDVPEPAATQHDVEPDQSRRDPDPIVGHEMGRKSRTENHLVSWVAPSWL